MEYSCSNLHYIILFDLSVMRVILGFNGTVFDVIFICFN